ncbi:hypothetical protein [Collimonas antrihumi]|uniref:hypothetical protein n=1 Tax=Collimonas antrihumi TaxID=1940615 RepID=UPI001B8BC142
MVRVLSNWVNQYPLLGWHGAFQDDLMNMGAFGAHIKRSSADASPGNVDIPLLQAKSTGFLQLVTKCRIDITLEYSGIFGLFFASNQMPPTDEYSPSVFSRTIIMSMSPAARPASGLRTPSKRSCKWCS